MKEIVKKLKLQNKTISTMESCTGGYIASEITNVESSSEVFKFGAVTYSNEFKIKMGVKDSTIESFSVYSKETAMEMAKSICTYTNSDYGIGITGKLLREDKNNKFKENNVVYIGVYCKYSNDSSSFHIIVDGKTRLQCKKHIKKQLIYYLNSII